MNSFKLGSHIESRITKFATILSLATAPTTALFAAEATTNTKQPNVLIILTDDQGYGDIGIHGNAEIETPNMNRLHNESVRLDNFHVDPTSAPTRSALVTGRYSHHVGVWHTINGGNHLRRGETTIAEVFKHNGYQTSLFGKWHLGANYPYRPIDRGFDEWLGLGDGGVGTTDDYFWNDRVNDHFIHNGELVERKGTTPEVVFSSAMEYMKAHKDDDKPMFVYLPSYTAHGPLMCDRKDIHKRHPKQPAYVGEFLSTIEDLDTRIGELDDFLHREGLSENTIVIFMTDNGGTFGCGIFNGGMTGSKGHITEGGHRVPCFIRAPREMVGAPRTIETLTAHIDILPTLVDLLQLDMPREVEFDGESLRPILEGGEMEERTLFVETQRDRVASPKGSSIMTQQWRLQNLDKLYDIQLDPAQRRDVAADHPEVVEKLLADFDKYWKKVTPRDREQPVPIIGNDADPETFLATSEYFDSDGYNHDYCGKGMNLEGYWYVEAEQSGVFDVEIRRWPREAAAPFNSVPEVTKKVDSYNIRGDVEVGVYTQSASQLKAIPIEQVTLKVGDRTLKPRIVKDSDEQVTFRVKIPKGKTTITSAFLDKEGKRLTNAYYVYIRKTK